MDNFFKSVWVQDILSVLIWVLAVILIQAYIVSPVEVKGTSMDTTLENGQRLMSVKIFDKERFDIVTLRAPDNPKKSYVKRIIGMPGDEIYFEDNQLYINGDKVTQDFLDEDLAISDTPNFGPINVPEGQYFVMGDHRTHSKDSRHFGCVNDKDIWGQVVFRFYPFNKAGRVK